MIEEPMYISRTGKIAPINLGNMVDPFNRADSMSSKVWYEGIVGIKWNKDEKEILASNINEGAEIFAYPTPDMEKMIVVKLGDNSGAPNNAIVLNDEAEVIISLQLPQRISKEKWLPRGGLYCFMQSGWCEYEDHIFFYFSIADTDWVETRYFNYKTMTWDNERYETWRL